MLKKVFVILLFTGSCLAAGIQAVKYNTSETVIQTTEGPWFFQFQETMPVWLMEKYQMWQIKTVVLRPQPVKSTDANQWKIPIELTPASTKNKVVLIGVAIEFTRKEGNN